MPNLHTHVHLKYFILKIDIFIFMQPVGCKTDHYQTTTIKKEQENNVHYSLHYQFGPELYDIILGIFSALSVGSWIVWNQITVFLTYYSNVNFMCHTKWLYSPFQFSHQESYAIGVDL